ncbi:MAG: PepSY-associated TM helix domain-containing protein [Pseudomonas sp.]|nr:PepSY-associated TM helix domain-containing protein [Pseudomonas sp.]
MKTLSFRQANSWLHTWSGLLVGWLLYAIFLTGTLSFFNNEISVWMKPEQHSFVADQHSAEQALTVLNKLAPDAQRWSVRLPSVRDNATQISYLASGEKDERGAGTSLLVNPQTGEVVEPRDTRGGSFFYRFHFQLYGIPVLTARWLVALATMFMFVAIISGVITHKKIFKDFFTFRPAKGQRSWLDAHNATAVLALPFHFMITYSGLLLLMFVFMPYGMNKAYDGDRRQFLNESEVFQNRMAARPSLSSADLQQKMMLPFAQLIADANSQLQRPIGSILIQQPNTEAAHIEIRESGANTIVNRGRGARLVYNAQGQLLEKDDAQPLAVSSAIYNVFTSLHLIRFADVPLRWLFFISGWLGTAMVATGLVMWVNKRQTQSKKLKTLPKNIRAVHILNVGTITGLAIACLGFFWANRLLPVELTQRATWEINVFLLCWLACFIHPLFRSHKQAWLEQLLLLAVLCVALVFYNLVFSTYHLLNGIGTGQWIVFSFDCTLLAFALLSYWAFLKVKNYAPVVRKSALKNKKELAV